MSARRHLRSVDVDSVSGEIVEACPHVAGCEHCSDREYALDQLERKYQGALSKIGRLERDEEEEARRHKLWGEAEALHTWWRLATGHLRTRFDHEDFYCVLPRLKERHRTAIDILRAVAGITFDPNKQTRRNGNLEIYDSWALVNGSKDKTDRYEQRAPGYPVSDTQWRIWLVERIESNFKEDG